MKFETTNKPLAAFSYSSLTDIVMLLLIFFLLTSQFVIQTGVKVKLPGAKNNEQTSPSRLIVTITSGGTVYLGSDPTAIDELGAKIAILKDQNLESNLIIRSDKDVPVDLVIRVIDAARGTGIDKFTIETEKEKL
ncbi:MAG: biopolymer transporter ExbD [Ignavibacteriaceae bacterium]|nr:biopolymer transporter ExbD [Ignavibacteriaceae bacterium]